MIKHGGQKQAERNAGVLGGYGARGRACEMAVYRALGQLPGEGREGQLGQAPVGRGLLEDIDKARTR